jgi:putative ABC transport system ATP-binding protein
MASQHDEPRTVYRVEQLAKTYGEGESAVHALRGVDLDVREGAVDVREGAVIVLLGPSGSGKSTLLNILGGLDRASEGRVCFYDRELTACGEDALTSGKLKFMRVGLG